MRRSYNINIIPTDNEILYTSLSKNIVTPYSTSVFGANIVSNEYSDLGKITFDNTVTKIGTNAFNGKTDLSTIVIPKLVTILDTQCFINSSDLKTVSSNADGITTIGNSAFYGCTSLASFDINVYNLKTIGNSAFKNTSIKRFIIPPSVTSIGSQAFTGAGNELSSLIIQCNIAGVSSNSSGPFYNNNFENITFVEGVTSIGDRTFVHDNTEKYLKYLEIPSTVKTIGSYTFINYNALENDLYLGNNITSFGNDSFQNVGNPNKYLTLYLNSNTPDKNSDSTNGYTGVFYQHQFGEIVFGENVTKVGNSTFYTKIISGDDGDTVLKKITFPDGLLTIGVKAFMNSSEICNDIIIPSSVTSFGEQCFRNCGKADANADVYLNCSTLNYGSTSAGPFYNSRFRKLITGGNCTSIGNYAFDGTNFTNVYLVQGVKTIGTSAFRNVSHSGDFTMPSTITTFGNYAFNNFGNNDGILYVNCNIPNGSTDAEPFRQVKFLGVIIGDGVTTIGNRAFINNINIRNVSIPSTVTSIGSNAFQGMTNVKDLTIDSTSCSFGTNAFNGFGTGEGTLSLNCNLPNSSSDAEIFKSAKFKNLVVKEGVTSLGNRSFIYHTTLENVSLPTTLTNIGAHAFNGCTNIVDLTLNTIGNCTIGDYAFYNIGDGSGTLEIHCNLPNSSSGSEIFKNAKFKNLIVAEGVTSIGNRSFINLTTLETVSLPSTITKLGDFSFHGCSSLGDVSITSPDCVLGATVFKNSGNGTGTVYINCPIPDSGSGEGNPEMFRGSNYKKFIFDNGCTKIGNRTFVGCSSVEEFNIRSTNLTTIGNNAFYGCSGLKEDMYIPSSVTSVGQNAFHGCGGTGAKMYIDCNLSTNYSSTDYSPFRYSQFEEIHIGEGVTTIGNRSIATNNSVTKVITLPSTLTSVGTNSIYNMTGVNSDVVLPASLVSIGNTAFYSIGNSTGAGNGRLIVNCNIQNYSSTDYSPFKNAKFSEVIINEGVTSIGNRALANMNSSVSAITISSTVTSIGDLAFNGLNNASTIFKIYATTPPSITSTTFNNTGTYKLQVPSGCGDAYKAAWSGVASRIIEMEE